MKTYLNKQGIYVTEEPKDGYFVCKDSLGFNAYTGDTCITFLYNSIDVIEVTEMIKNFKLLVDKDMYCFI